MARRSGLGQRGLDILIPASSGLKQSEKKKTEKKKSSIESSEAKKKKVVQEITVTEEKEVSTDTEAKEETDVKEAVASGRGNEISAAGKIETEKTGAGGSDTEDSEYESAGSEIADLQAASPEENEKIPGNAQLDVDINSVEPNRDQPRKQFDDDSLQELADSIRMHGVIQPLIVQKKDDYYEIIAGERRWRAAKIAGLKTIPVLVRDYSDQEVMELSLIENIQRQDLNPIEEANAFRRLIEEYDLTQDQVAGRVSKSRTAVTNSLRLLKLDFRVQDMLISEILTMGHARALLAIEDGDLQFQVAQKAFDDKMSVRDVEAYVKKLLKKPAPEKRPAISQQLQTIYKDMEEQMKTSLGTKVSIQSKTPEKGKIEIEYFTSDELERIYNAILSGRT